MSAHEGPVIAESDGYAVRDCATCGWAHLDPIPDEAELALMYERTYYQEQNPGWLQKDRAEQAYWDLEQADKLADWSAALAKPAGDLLDVGCSGGLLIEHAVKSGWRAEGIEPSEEAVDEARSHGLTVHMGLFEDVDISPASFDVVHSKLVMEHLPRPRAFLEWARRVLRPGGIFSAQVPNDFTSLQLRARDALSKPDWWVAPPFHINYFNFDSMERLMRSCGFEPVKRDATFPMEWFLLMGDDYVGNGDLGLSMHHKRMRLEHELEGLGMRRPYHEYLAAHGVGREAIVHGRMT
ncbi:MAG: class I SAM-dependent methyltransferase [Thermoleophilaceae bacterium]